MRKDEPRYFLVGRDELAFVGDSNGSTKEEANKLLKGLGEEDIVVLYGVIIPTIRTVQVS